MGQDFGVDKAADGFTKGVVFGIEQRAGDHGGSGLVADWQRMGCRISTRPRQFRLIRIATFLI
jgi:hypothetical protein